MVSEKAGAKSGHPQVVRVTAVYALCHLVVDLACVSTLLGTATQAFGLLGMQAKALALLAYDMVAFCMQLPLGALLDAVGRKWSRVAALLSFALVAAGVLAPFAPSMMGVGMSPLTAAGLSIVLVALGNALFHCVGGVEVLGESDAHAGPSGAFISLGAIGLFVGGQRWFNALEVTPWILLALLVAAAAGVLWLGRLSDEPGGILIQLKGTGWAAVVLLAATVALRSYTGMVMSFPWKTGLALAVCVVSAVVLGKALGGFLADRIGLGWASLISLGGAAAAFAFSWESNAAGLAGTFLFNFTMAITLSALARLLPLARGTAFGIASFSLAMGALPALLGVRVSSARALVVLSLASLVLLELGLAFMRRQARDE